MTTNYTPAARWTDALTAFEIAQRATGIADETIENRLAHVRRLADSIALSPARVSYEDLRGWLDRLPYSRHTMLAYRTSFRAFFRWATASGRINQDPSAEPSYVTQKMPVPELWRADLGDC